MEDKNRIKEQALEYFAHGEFYKDLDLQLDQFITTIHRDALQKMREIFSKDIYSEEEALRQEVYDEGLFLAFHERRTSLAKRIRRMILAKPKKD